MRTLPLRLIPAEAESFASYVDRLAYRLRAPLGALLEATGVGIPYCYGIALEERSRKAFAAATGLEERQVDALLLTTYDGLAIDLGEVDLSRPHGLRRGGTWEWAYLVGSHVCPSCMDEACAQAGPPWQLRWKLPWLFACTKHRRLLVDTCPRCRRRTGVGRPERKGGLGFPTVVPAPGLCANSLGPGEGRSGRGARPCRQPLADIKTVSLGRSRAILEAQASLEAALDGAPQHVGSQPVSTLTYFRDLRSLCALILYGAEADDLRPLPEPLLSAFTQHVEEREQKVRERERVRAEGGGRSGPRNRTFAGAPKSAALMAAIAPRAVTILAPPSKRDLAAELSWLVERVNEAAPRGAAHLVAHLPMSPPLRSAWSQATARTRGGRPRYRSLALTAGLHTLVQAGTEAGFGPDQVPQLLWEGVYDERFAGFFPGVERDTARRFLSLALVKLVRRCSWGDAGRALGIPPQPARSCSNHVMHELEKAGASDLALTRVCELARELDDRSEELTNYGSRRRALMDFRLIRRLDWERICRRAGWPLRDDTSLRRLAAAWAWCRATGGDYRFAPPLAGDDRKALQAAFRRFLDTRLATFAESLREYADSTR